MTSLRDDKKRKQRDALVDAAIALFVEQGYDAARVHDIALRAGVSDKTFFNYFPSKDDVLTAFAVRVVEEYAALLPEPDPEAPIDLERVLLRSVRALARSVAAEPELMRLVWTRSRFFVAEGEVKERWMAVYAKLEALFAAAQKQGALAPGVPPLQLAEIFFGAVHLTVVNWLVDWWPKQERLETRLRRATQCFVRGAAAA